MQFFDTISLGQAVEISGVRETRNGSLVMQARAARGGNVQDYLGAEVGKPEMAVVRVYRDADEVFHKDSLKTFAHKAVTLGHPAEPVTSRTWKDVARGHTGDEVLRDGEFVKIPMLVADQVAIDAVRGGTRELSMGYQCDLDFTAGTSPSGEVYDARQVHITIDHVAIVPLGRAGPDCRIGDGLPADGKTMRPLTPIADTRTVSMKTHLIDGHAVEMSDAAIIAVSNLQKQNGTLVADNLSLTTSLTAANTAVQTKDGEIAALKQKLVDAEMTPAKLDAAVATRAKVIGDARKIAGESLVVDGKTDAEIRRAAVATKLGDAATALSDEAVAGAFLTFAHDAKPDPLRQMVGDGLTQQTVGDAKAKADAAQAKRTADLRNAWKGKAA
jgi:hypothetical protein